MELTGKCKKAFAQYLIDLGNAENDYSFYTNFHGFERLPESMRYGVYVRFFESVDIYPQAGLYPMPSMRSKDEDIEYYSVVETNKNYHALGFHKKRDAAELECIDKSNELFNAA